MRSKAALKCGFEFTSHTVSPFSEKRMSTPAKSSPRASSAATCTAAKKCSPCGITEGNALGHTTTSGKCGRCGQEISKASQCTLKLKQTLPATVNYHHRYSGTESAEIQEILNYTFSDLSNGTIEFRVTVSGKILSSNIAHNVWFYIKITSPSGKTFSDIVGFSGLAGDSDSISIYIENLYQQKDIKIKKSPHFKAVFFELFAKY